MKLDILLYKDVIINYLVNFKKLLKNDFDLFVITIICNPENRFIMTKEYFNFLELYFLEFFDEHLEKFQVLYTELSDNSRIYRDLDKVIRSSETQSFDEEFQFIFKEYPHFLKIILCLKRNDFLKKFDFFICEIENSVRPNVNWICLRLAANREFIIYNYHFESQLQIQHFLADVFSLPKSLLTVQIFDNYVNTNNVCFDLIASKGPDVEYYSSKIINQNLLTKSELQLKKNEIRKKFSNNAKYFVTTNFKLTHRRRIIFNNIIIGFDHDFQFLQLGNHWFINVNLSDKNFYEEMSNVSSYEEIK